MNANDLLTVHFPRLRAGQKSALDKLGIATIRDLLYHFPTRYENAGPTGTISSITHGDDVTLYGTIRNPKTRKAWKSRRPIAEALLEDSSGTIKMMWFNQPYIVKSLHDGMLIKVTGRVAGNDAKIYLANPEINRTPVRAEDIHDNLFANATEKSEQTLYPIYQESKGISSLWMYHAVKKCIASGVHEQMVDAIPKKILTRYHLPKLATSLIWIHMPQTLEDSASARKRFSFEEVFTIQLMMARRRQTTACQKALPVTVDREALASFVSSFPFKPTQAQTRAINTIVDDFEKPRPMMRLLEGDVGSGKTAIAAATSYLVATSRPPKRKSGTLQVAYLCPTEILAKQHFETFIAFFKDHPIKIGLITGSGCRKFPSKISREKSTHISRAQFQRWVANGEIPIVIGTHSLVQKSLSFKTLAYAIIDEQHRFGKVHRQELARKDGLTPHLLSMTATPIPRTLALTIYGDLDLTLVDQMPLGRKPIITKLLGPEKREEAYVRVRKELEKGRQAYVICPRIDEPDPNKELSLQAKSVKAEAVRLEKYVFPDASIGILHSKMKPAEKEESMEKFENGETQILVATSVVEVGVNVPNATVMLIEGAERFGLAQLHQLRGRVIRSSNQAYCFVLPESYGPTTRERLSALTKAKNGFELAEYDLSIRGAGELYGKKQWGVSDVAMEALRNIKLVEAARTEAGALIKKDPDLSKHSALASLARSRERDLHGE
ncbi:ATP-dependent DNA helicase RecG [hydrothermal vent metagenome]|uniref:Probable DNA 3'-5' helicase RecG n=1 Tax=hydrothermal vent metagenome TaxID=652676 RepID=A0A3B0ULX3_9ZZZZ